MQNLIESLIHNLYQILLKKNPHTEKRLFENINESLYKDCEIKHTLKFIVYKLQNSLSKKDNEIFVNGAMELEDPLSSIISNLSEIEDLGLMIIKKLKLSNKSQHTIANWDFPEAIDTLIIKNLITNTKDFQYRLPKDTIFRLEKNFSPFLRKGNYLKKICDTYILYDSHLGSPKLIYDQDGSPNIKMTKKLLDKVLTQEEKNERDVQPHD